MTRFDFCDDIFFYYSIFTQLELLVSRAAVEWSSGTAASQTGQEDEPGHFSAYYLLFGVDRSRMPAHQINRIDDQRENPCKAVLFIPGVPHFAQDQGGVFFTLERVCIVMKK